MRKKLITTILAAAGLTAALAVFPMSVNAATPDEAAAVARAYGYPEDIIQEGWNTYNANPELYPPEKIDEAIAVLHERGSYIAPTQAYDPGVTIPALTTTAAPQQQQTAVTTAVSGSSGGNTGTGGSGGNTGTGSSGSGEITLTMPDGSTFTRISREQFIALSYDDKLKYFSTFTPEQQNVLIADLSPEEYKAMMKQLPADQKMEVIEGLTAITDDMGLTLTVDEITDDSMKITMKDEDGTLKAVARAGDTVENTGYDRRGIFAFSGAMLLAALGGIFIIVKKCFGNDDPGAENE